MLIVCIELYEAWEKVTSSTKKMAVLGWTQDLLRTNWLEDRSQQNKKIVYIIELRWNLRAGGPEVTKDAGAHVTSNYHSGYIPADERFGVCQN